MKLFEVLAIEADRTNAAKRIMEEAITVFTKKPNLFSGRHKTTKMFEEGRSNEDTVEAQAVTETVDSKLAYISESIANMINVTAMKETANQSANADIIVDGVKIAENVPATMLLNLEHKLSNIRDVLLAIPTLSSGIHWESDPGSGVGIFRTKLPDITFRTEKEVKHKVLVAATDKHPAQIEKWSEDVKVGRIETTNYSGMISPAKKSEYMTRIDKLMSAVKTARQRANAVEVNKSIDIGNNLMAYVIQ